jgi:hypothetical protein
VIANVTSALAAQVVIDALSSSSNDAPTMSAGGERLAIGEELVIVVSFLGRAFPLAQTRD